MKKNKILYLIVFFIIMFFVTGCGNQETTKDSGNELMWLKEITGEIYQAQIDNNGDIVIDKNDITENVSYYSYEYEGVTISLLAVKDENENIHIVINTCGSCGGSPYAYFVQVGNKIQCQNCGNTFLITDLDNLVPDGCNPIEIENMSEEDEKFIIDHEELEQYKDKFENWKGPKS